MAQSVVALKKNSNSEWNLNGLQAWDGGKLRQQSSGSEILSCF